MYPILQELKLIKYTQIANISPIECPLPFLPQLLFKANISIYNSKPFSIVNSSKKLFSLETHDLYLHT